MTAPQFFFDETPQQFLERAGPLLYQHEAVNSLMLGLCGSMSPDDSEKPLLLRIAREGRTISAIVQTPPMNLVLTYCPKEILPLLAEELFRRGVRFPGVVGPAEESELFARIWSDRTGLSLSLGMGQKIYQLRKVIFPAVSEGHFAVAVPADADLIEKWTLAFTEESLPASDNRSPDFWKAYARRAADQGTAHFWRVGDRTVAMAHVSRKTAKGVSINGVYTPPEFRRKGYASSLVAHLSQKMLDSGKQFCVLYTDLANPTSNRIYRQVGFEEVADSKHFVFS